MGGDKLPKNIVIFSDGTSQEGGKGFNSNVYKLFNAVEDRTERQVTFYDQGLGTEWRRKVTGSGAGMGISKNILECYEFLFDNYEAHDRIYLFGFSRGAYTVRSLAGFIDLFGVLPKARRELIRKAWKLYKTRNRDNQRAKADAFVKKHHTMWCDIHFIGVWDTVSALGVPFRGMDRFVNKVPWFKHKFHRAGLSEGTLLARQALSIDDVRTTFHPELWSEDNANRARLVELTGGNRVPRVKQVWFPGVHTDVGGGYRETGLSDFTLKWMSNEALDAGLLIYRDAAVAVQGNASDVLHDSTKGGFGRFYRTSTRSLKTEIDRPLIHQSVIDRSNDPALSYDPWLLNHASYLEGEYDLET